MKNLAAFHKSNVISASNSRNAGFHDLVCLLTSYNWDSVKRNEYELLRLPVRHPDWQGTVTAGNYAS